MHSDMTHTYDPRAQESEAGLPQVLKLTRALWQDLFQINIFLKYPGPV